MRKLSKKKILIIFILVFILFFLLLVFLKVYFDREYQNNFKINVEKLCEKLSVVDFNDDHNQILDVMNYAKNKVTFDEHILINIDTHSDVYMYSPDFGKRSSKTAWAGIANWMNYYILQNPSVSEIYWVIPDKMLDNPRIMDMFVKKETSLIYPLFGNCRKDIIDIAAKIGKQPFVQNFYININNQDDFVEPINDIEENKYKNNKNFKKIKFVTCTIDKLPIFTGGENFVLSVDFDYFSNSGFDTNGNFNTDKDENGIKKLFVEVLEKLCNKNVQPEIISLSLSPEYVPYNDIDTMKKIANDFIEYSKKNDVLRSYKYKRTNFACSKGVRRLEKYMCEIDEKKPL